MSPDRAARVRAAVAELGYQPFGPARALRLQATDVWAVIVADIENPFFTSIVRGIEDGGREHGFRVMLCNSDEDLRKEADYVDVAIAERMAGVVIAVASTRASTLDPLLDAGSPSWPSIADPAARKVDSVLVDNERGAAEATTHLIEAGATPHRLHHRSSTTQYGERAVARLSQGTADTRARTRSLGGRSDRLPRDRRVQGDARAVLVAEPPDAVLVANNLMTVGALEALRDEGLSVPGDVRVVGFDDAPWAKLLQPSLTVVAQPTYEIGRRSAELLLTAAPQPARPRQEVLLHPQSHRSGEHMTATTTYRAGDRRGHRLLPTHG